MTDEERDFWLLLSALELQAERVKAETEHDGVKRILKLAAEIRRNDWVIRNMGH